MLCYALFCNGVLCGYLRYQLVFGYVALCYISNAVTTGMSSVEHQTVHNVCFTITLDVHVFKGSHDTKIHYMANPVSRLMNVYA